VPAAVAKEPSWGRPLALAISAQRLTAAKAQLKEENLAPFFHSVQGLQQQLTLAKGPLLGPIPRTLVVLATVVNPDIVWEEFGGGLIPAEEMGNNLPKMHSIRARRHLARAGELAQRCKSMRLTINVLVFFDVLIFFRTWL
jgi:hypothetical protein